MEVKIGVVDSPRELIIVSNLTYSWPARRFRSNWMAIIVHAAEGLPVLALVLAIILGLFNG